MYRFILYGLILVGMMACQARTDLKAALLEHWQATQAAHALAASHWDQLIIAGVAKCERGLPLVPPFSLSQKQADEYPPSVAIRDQLNRAVALLQASADLWDQICGIPAPEVPPSQANQGYLLLQEAEAPLSQAQLLLAQWQP